MRVDSSGRNDYAPVYGMRLMESVNGAGAIYLRIGMQITFFGGQKLAEPMFTKCRRYALNAITKKPLRRTET